MDALPFRATVFLRPAGLTGSVMLMERHFKAKADAVAWCEVMSAGHGRATGSWMVAETQAGRELAVRQSAGVSLTSDADAALMERMIARAPELSEAEVATLISDVPPLNAPVRLRPALADPLKQPDPPLAISA